MYEWTIALALIACCAVYYWLARKNYFEENEITYVKLTPIVGTLGIFLFPRKTIWEFFDEFYRAHKDSKYIGFYELNKPIIFINDPELIKTITIKHFDHFLDHRSFVSADVEPFFGKNLFTLKGDRWREIRTLLSLAFTSSKMKAMFKLMSSCAENFADYLNEKAETGSFTVDSKEVLCRYTSDVIATCAFGVAVDSMRNPDNEFYVLGRNITTFRRFDLLKFVFMAVFPGLSKLVGLRFLGRKIQDFFTQLVKNTVETRDREGIVRPDMIQLMMESRSNEPGEGPQLDIDDMTVQAFIFFLGGFDTSSNLMCFAAHLISAHPDVQGKLRDEVDEVYEECGGSVTYDAINGMKYLEAIIYETMRLYPVGPPIDRVCTKSFELPPSSPGKKPVVLEPGALVSFSNYSTQRDPEYFPDPEEFRPERFIEDPDRTLHSAAYFPFGIGPRMCIGNRFAILEIKVLLFHLIINCSLEPGDKMIMPLVLDPSIPSMVPKGGFWLKLQPRNKWKSKTHNIAH